MNVAEILQNLQREREALDAAIAALAPLSMNGAGERQKRKYVFKNRKRKRQMSAEARARISAAMKARWAKRLKK